MGESQHIEQMLKRHISSPQPELWNREWENIKSLLRLSGIKMPVVGIVVDAGCGLQGLRVPVEKDGLAYFGLDIDDLNFEKERISVLHSDVQICISLAVIEHLESPLIYLDGLLKSLEPGGALVLSTPNIAFAKESFWDNPGHLRPYSSKSLSLLLKAVGFDVRGVFPGLRAKPDWMMSFRWSFHWASRLPIRKNHTRGVLRFFSGRSTSVFVVATAPQI